MAELKQVARAAGIISLIIFIGWVLMVPDLIRVAIVSPLTALVALGFFLIEMGTVWMLYDVIRQKRPLIPIAIIAFIPLAFVWYFFAKYRSPASHN